MLHMHDTVEMSGDARRRMRTKHASKTPEYDAYAHMSDEWIADTVFMLDRNDLGYAAVTQAARDRIMRLSLEIEALRAQLGADS
jgi:hypothetical protein